jgi:hypothetical protein
MSKDDRTPPPNPSKDPPEMPVMLWGLRLWILAALVIIAFALANYFLNWWVR